MIKVSKPIFIVISVLIVAVFLFGKFRFDWFEKTTVEEGEKLKVGVEYIPQGTLPKEIPTDIPLEEGAPMQRNEIVKSADGAEEQYVYRFYSQKTVAENFDIYKKYLKDGGWVIKNSSKDANSAFLLANKEGKAGNMQITISKNSITGDITVEINVIISR